MTFYIGPEVNHTPAFSKKTLFVEDWHDTKVIEATAKENKTQHISLGVNGTFSLETTWNKQVTELLASGFVVTLSYPVELHNRLMFDLSKAVYLSRNFIMLPVVRIMDMSTTNPNLTVKIDDMAGEGTWTLHYHQLMDSNRFASTRDIMMEEVPAVVTAVTTPAPVVSKPAPKPVAHIDSAAEILMTMNEQRREIPQTPIKNDQDLGLDPDSPSMLKPDTEEPKPAIVMKSPEEAAEAYAGTETKSTKKSPAKAKK